MRLYWSQCRALWYELGCTSWHESCLSLETMGCSLKWGNRFENSTKLPFFDYIKSTFALFFRIGCHVNRLLGWKPTIAVWLFIHHLKQCLVDSFQSCFNTSRFTSIWSWFNTHLKSIQLPDFKPWRSRCKSVNYGISDYWFTQSERAHRDSQDS